MDLETMSTQRPVCYGERWRRQSMNTHTRSNSLPSQLNLIFSQFDEQISRIRSSESASSSSTDSKLTHLSNLYKRIDGFLQLPSSEMALFSKSHEKSVQDSLEGSIKLLDVCSIISDVCMKMKQCARELQSILRRRCSEDEISEEVAKYLKSKKTAMKAVSKALKEFKKMENNYSMASNETVDMINRLRDCQMVTLNVLESVLVAMVGDKANSRWESVVSNLMKSNKQETASFFVGSEAMDSALNPEKVRIQFENMEIRIKDVEQGVESLFRHLIKTRTTILNILNF